MPPFKVSVFKNATVAVKKESVISEVPVSTSNTPYSIIKSTPNYAAVLGSSPGSIVFTSYDEPGKYGNKAPTLNAVSGNITDFDISLINPLLATASDKGTIALHKLPNSVSKDKTQLDIQSAGEISAGRSTDIVAFHPSVDGLLLSSSGPSLQLWDVSDLSKPLRESDTNNKGLHSAAWCSSQTADLVTTGKDNALNLWDFRGNTDAIATTQAHQGLNKPSRVCWVGERLLTTGFSKTRDREIALWDPRNFQKPIKQSRLDTNNGLLVPLVDQSRNLVYLFGRGDMNVRHIEVAGSSFTEGITNLPHILNGACMIPATSSSIDIMKAEISPFTAVTKEGSVVTLTSSVPRRQYIDFHADLYPLYEQTAPQTVSEWQQGESCHFIPVKPSPTATNSGFPLIWPCITDNGTIKSAVVERKQSQSIPEPVIVQPTLAGEKPPEAFANASAMPLENPHEELVGAETNNEPTKVVLTPPVSVAAALKADEPAQPKTSPSTNPARQATSSTANTAKEAYNPGWSRKFLAGKSALKPEYNDVHALNATLPATVQLLKANDRFLVFPLSGAGGQLGVHPVNALGRLPTHIPACVSGSGIVDFELDPYDPSAIFVANEDGRIRVFQIEGDVAATMDPSFVLEDGMDKITELKMHPGARHILLTVSSDGGKSVARLWHTESRMAKVKFAIAGGGVHSSAWSSNGRWLAVTCKDKQLRVVNPRSADSLASCAAHDSVRPSHAIFAGNDHIITTGFTKSSNREVRLYAFDSASMTTKNVAKLTLDVSPSPFFAHYDSDTNILFLWSKGERTVYTFQLNFSPPGFDKLPSFTHDSLQSALSFAPKTQMDVIKVEVAKAWRLGQRDIRQVSFTIPRAKTELFQDDIFIPTLDTRNPVMSGDEYFAGSNATQPLLDLRPPNMPLLSDAPNTVESQAEKAAKSRAAIAKQEHMSDEKKSEEYFDKLFAKSQKEAVDSSDDETAGGRRVPPPEDDDW